MNLPPLAHPHPAGLLPPGGSEGQPELGPPGLPPNAAELVQRPTRADRERVAAADSLRLPRAPAVPPSNPHVPLPPPRDPLKGLVGRLQVEQLQPPALADVRADAQQPRRGAPRRTRGTQARYLRGPSQTAAKRGEGRRGGRGGRRRRGKGQARAGEAQRRRGRAGGGEGRPTRPESGNPRRHSTWSRLMQGQPAWDSRCFTSPRPLTPAGEPGARPSIGLPGPPPRSGRLHLLAAGCTAAC